MKKIALIAINSRSSHSNPTLFAIKKTLSQNDEINPVLLELTINENWRESLVKLTDLDADIYLFSVYIWNRTYIERLLPLLKTVLPSARMILGGPEITYNMEFWQEHDWLDVLVSGQAESFIPHLLTFDEKVFRAEPVPIDEVVFPYDESDREALEGRLVYYEASRGCLFNCSYCLSSCDRGKPEYRNIETVKEELLKLIGLKPKIVKMVDRTFNSNISYAREIWRFLIDLESPVPFHFELHPLFLEDEDFALLEKAHEGLFYFEVGIQSTDREVLKAVHRPWNRPKEKKNIDRLCALKNIHTHLDQIVGLPGDTIDIASRSFNEILAHRPDEFQLGFLKILPGTPLSEEAEHYKLKAAAFPPYEVVESENFPLEDMKVFYRVEADLNRYYNSDYFPRILSYLMDQFSDSWSFFQCLSGYSPENRQSKQWAVLGKSLLALCEKELHADRDYVIDLLRYDWCPFASGQSFPPFLRLPIDETIKEMRRESYSRFAEKIEGFTRREFNHSILFSPSSVRMRNEGVGTVLFYRRDGGSISPEMLQDD